MNQRSFLSITSSIFGIIALLHLGRIIYEWPAVIGTVTIPVWASWVALVVGGYLAWNGFNLKKRL